jgi:tRNA threonylcarbamoyladenosine biosynthesis protein TsaB
MKILAVEFSSSRRGVAVWDTAGASGQPVLLGSSVEVSGRGALGLVAQALAEARTSREEIGVVAVGLGPGSYTGIRGAIALAQGWQLGRGVKLLGLGGVPCLAAQARAEGLRGAVNIIIDSQRNEFSLARWELGGDAARQTAPLRLAGLAEIQAMAHSGEVLIGPDILRWFPGAKNMHPCAVMLGRVALAHPGFFFR